MTEDEFVKSLEEAYQKHKAAFPKKMERCFEDIAKFAVIKQIVTKDEFAYWFKVFKFGQVDEVKIEKAYELFTAAHGKPTVQL